MIFCLVNVFSLIIALFANRRALFFQSLISQLLSPERKQFLCFLVTQFHKVFCKEQRFRTYNTE